MEEVTGMEELEEVTVVQMEAARAKMLIKVVVLAGIGIQVHLEQLKVLVILILADNVIDLVS